MLRLPRILHVNKQVNTLITMEGRTGDHQRNTHSLSQTMEVPRLGVRKWETSQPGTRPQAETNEKKWETNERKWETSQLVSHSLSFVSHLSLQAGCLWWGFRLACLPLPCICLPLLFICLPGRLVVGFPAGFSPTSFHLSPRLGACRPVRGWLVSHFLAFVSHFLLFVSHFFSFICLPHWMLVVGFPAGLSPTSFLCGWLVSHFLSFVSRFFSLVSQFFSFVSQAGCLGDK